MSIDHYLNMRLYRVEKCCGSNQFRIKESILMRNSDGMLGSCGDGPTCAVGLWTKTGVGSFNPEKEERIVYHNGANAFVYRNDISHFEFPFVVNEFYYLIDGIKTAGVFCSEEIIPRIHSRYSTPFTVDD